MKYKNYSPELWNTIHSTLDAVLQKDPNPVAAFDADGTLWDTDLGEAFFQHQIDHKLVKLPADPWDFYQKAKVQDPRRAYLWLAQICKGHKLSEVHEWARQALKEISPVPVFSEQQKLIELFLSKGVRVYVITASVKWAVEPGAEMLGLKYDDVIGIETDVDGELIGDKQKGLITYKEGKVDALLAKTGGKKPFFASGNTMGDFQLLQSATHLRLAVSAAAQDDGLYRTEYELSQEATTHSWMKHRFV
jgi:HAD superfamily phosphoserine phosphatase-like hydrolase